MVTLTSDRRYLIPPFGLLGGRRLAQLHLLLSCTLLYFLKKFSVVSYVVTNSKVFYDIHSQ